MAFVLKTAPQNTYPGATVTVSERAFFGGKSIARGADVFLWFAEQQGGTGLAFQGRVADTTMGTDGKPSITCILTNAAVRPLDNSALEPWRDVDDGSALAGLARKLYKHAHNKIAALTAAEADLLRGHFLSRT